MDGMTINHMVSIDHGSYANIISGIENIGPGPGDPQGIKSTSLAMVAVTQKFTRPGKRLHNCGKIQIHHFFYG